jgi:hypothetical protein
MPCCLSCVGGCLGSSPQPINCIDAANTSGTTAYNPYTSTCATGGVVNSAANPLPAPDASGGNGNFLAPLQQVMVQGLNDAVVSATEFGLGALNDRLAVAAQGPVQPAAAQSPATAAKPGAGIGTLLLVGGAIAALFFLV